VIFGRCPFSAVLNLVSEPASVLNAKTATLFGDRGLRNL
jgi:hypothetical protein